MHGALRLWWMGMALLAAPGCATVQLRPPVADLTDTAPVRPAAQPSHIAAVLRLSHAQSGRLVEAKIPAETGASEQLGPLQATWKVRREGRLDVAADARQRLCFDTPFAGNGQVSVFGQSLQRELRAQVRACARPALDGLGVVRLADPDAQVTIQRETVGGPVAMLKDAVAKRLQTMASEEISRQLTTVAVPLQTLLQPIQALLARPIAVGQDACLKLRAQRLDVAQPVVDPGALRFGAALVAMPTLERPCIATPDTTRPLPLTPQVVPQLPSAETVLVLPIGLGLDTLLPQVQAAVDQLGRLETAQGWMRIGKVTLGTAKGRLLVRAAISGEVQDKVLFIPLRRTLSGEVLLWGTPRLQADAITLPDLELQFDTDDKLVALATSLRRSDLVANVRDKLKIPRARIDAEASKALASLARHIEVGGELLPVVVQTQELTLQDVIASGQRLEVLVRFRGQVVIGDRAAK
jgi:hypothetical protein